ncbi:unannotated protein [freshwater metagenome]|uniref:Unannotated protein n=1 Tax=freshwater metagenome TaxID=449393 RepID=A0A6J7DID4_9ZZZZ
MHHTGAKMSVSVGATATRFVTDVGPTVNAVLIAEVSSGRSVMAIRQDSASECASFWALPVMWAWSTSR